MRDAIEMDHRTRAAVQADASIGARLDALTRRERQVLERVLAGETSRRIATELFISVKTVDFHRGRIMQKLEITSLRELFPIRAYLERTSERVPARERDT